MKNQIVEMLTKKLNYSEHEADVTAEDLMNLHPLLQPALQAWFVNGAITDATLHGFSVGHLMEQRSYTFPAALIAFDWLLTEPDVAKVQLSEKIRR